MAEEISESGNARLAAAQRAKKNEFYTQYSDIQSEMNAYVTYNKDVFRDKTVLLPCDDPEWSNFTRYFAANFEWLGLKKLISTSYAKEENGRGKLFTLDEDINDSGTIDIDDLKWEYLEGNGDFRSDEVTRLRDEADIIVTNPPFSLFREFLAWILDGGKEFSIIGNQNAITYKEVFPLIKENKIWLGEGFRGNVGFFESPYQDVAKASDHRDGFIRVSGVMWFTNLEHGKRHEFMQLDTMEHSLKYNKRLRKIFEESYGKIEYPHYDNYDAIEVPITNCIPSDYDGVMGVPITFLDKFNPEQFEILGLSLFIAKPIKECIPEGDTYQQGGNAFYVSDGNHHHKRLYGRIAIRHKMGATASSRHCERSEAI